MKRAAQMILLSAAVATSGCDADERPPSDADVIGCYIGRYGDGIENIELKTDGNFDQTFQQSSNVMYAASGKWKLSEGRVHFEPFISPDAILSGTPDGRPDSRPRSFGTWHRGPVRIELGEWPYYVVKVKCEGVPGKPLTQ